MLYSICSTTWQTTQEIFAFIASIVSILAFGSVIISVIIWLCNLTRKNTIKPTIDLGSPTTNAINGLLVWDMDICFRNLSNRTFYISDIYLEPKGKRLELFKRPEAHKGNFLSFAPLKVEPYEPICLHCSAFVKYGFEFGNKIALFVTIGKKTCKYDIAPNIVKK